MGKIVKFCSECEEGFAEKFGFCPNCGSSLDAFEMNPLQKESVKANAVKAELSKPENPAFITSSQTVSEKTFIDEPEIAETNRFSVDEDILELNVEGNENEEIISEPEIEPEVYAPAATVFSTNGNSNHNNYQHFSNADAIDDNEDDGFHVTVIEEKNVRERNMLLLGSTVLILMLAFGGFVYSLFAKTLDLGAIGNEDYIAAINDVTPIEIEEPEPPKPAEKESGGGGGGGREEQTETSKGRLATQSREEPLIRPDVNILQRSNPELKQPVATTVGDKKIKPTDEPYGNPNSTSAFGSNGRGRGGGQGEGDGTGQGNGRGTGAGNGNGSGFGNGDGDGNGNGTGSGRTRIAENNTVPPAPAGPSKGLQITYKPKPKYTDEARQNNITGNVRVRVTFLPSGQIGSVSPVSNLGYGLTEQAIAAAKQMKFEPQMVNGRPVAVTKVVVFTFTIY